MYSVYIKNCKYIFIFIIIINFLREGLQKNKKERKEKKKNNFY